MLSSGTSYKIKKKDIYNYNDDKVNKVGEHESIVKFPSDDYNRKISNNVLKDVKGKGKSKSDFKPFRSFEKKGVYRYQGNAIKRNERDVDSNYVLTRKSNDDFVKIPDSSHLKSGISEKAEIKFNFPEDIRISKLLRRLSVENNQTNSLMISSKLLEVLMFPDNALYICKAFSILGDSILDIFQSAPGLKAKCQAAKCLGRMGYVMGQEGDFGRFQSWIFNKMQHCHDDISFLIMIALKETLQLEKFKPFLQMYSKELLQDLAIVIELSDNFDLFKAALDNLIMLVEMYPEHFYSQFRDIVDVLLGWHVDHNQPLTNIEYISQKLQIISKHFQVNIDFSFTMIIHFLEDITTYTSQLHKRTYIDDNNSEISSIEYITVFILALNTLIKCLGPALKQNENDITPHKIVIDCLTQIIQTTIEALESFVPDNLTIAANECISMLLGLLSTKSLALVNAMLNLINSELSLSSEFSVLSVISMLKMISVSVKELSANLPIELIPLLLGPKSEIIKLRNSPHSNIQEAVLYLYRTLLNVKNIPLLQEVYRYILGDFEILYKTVLPNVVLLGNNPFIEISCPHKDIEFTIIFLLSTFSEFATASGSIIGMWALQPSILKFLTLLQPYNPVIAKNIPILQYNLLYLLYSHCKCYKHYISNSDLISDKSTSKNFHSVPDSLNTNTGNFSIILDVLFNCFNSTINIESVLLILNWFDEILTTSKFCLEILYKKEKFQVLVNIVVQSGFTTISEIALSVNYIIEKLLTNKSLAWNYTFLASVCSLCTLHMKSNNKKLRDSYTKLSLNIPWDVSFLELAKTNNFENFYCEIPYTFNNHTITNMQRLHMNGTVFSEISQFHFKMIVNYLLNPSESCDYKYLENLFITSWPIESTLQNYIEQYRNLALSVKVILNNWLTWEAAQYCVNSKLRTPLGKPNETFSTFEVALKTLANIVTKSKQGNDNLKIKNTDNFHLYLFLQFIEYLEISMYNASEGSAIAISHPTKHVRAFFSTNALTCKEWLSRIRILVIQLSLSAGQSSLAYRHIQALLADFIEQNKSNTVEFNTTIMYAAIALLNLKESAVLEGLYKWCLTKFKKDLIWLRPAIDQINKNFEIAIEGYEKAFNCFESNEADEIRYFVIDQIITCYINLNCWENVIEWNKIMLRDCKNIDSKFYFKSVSNDLYENILNFENMNLNSFNVINQWETQPSRWCLFDVVKSVENNLFNLATCVANGEKVQAKVNKELLIVEDSLQHCLFSNTSEYIQSLLLHSYTLNGLKNILNECSATSVFLVSENFENEIIKIDSNLLLKILWWSERFIHIQNNRCNTFCNNLRLNIIKKARKENNFNLASKQLQLFFQQKGFLKVLSNDNRDFVLQNIGTSLMQSLSAVNISNIDNVKAMFEVIKLLYISDFKSLAFNLSAVVSTSVSKFGSMHGRPDLLEISAKILLNLAKWLQLNKISLTEIDSPLVKLLMVLPDITSSESFKFIPEEEMPTGKLLQFSVQHCINLAKSWNLFGTWCYRWGRKILHNRIDLAITLSNEDKLLIKTNLPSGISFEDLDRVFNILSQPRPDVNNEKKSTVDEDDIDFNEINTSELILEQLLMIPSLEHLNEVHLNELINIWKKIQKRIFVYYELSANAYFKYLQLTADSSNALKATRYNSITVTLRLLRLITRHALELQHVLENGLASTPTNPWLVIIPQLFSRLSHPETYVRQRVSDLLCRIAENSPHLITFPAVVGALEGGLKFNFSEITLPEHFLSQNEESNDTELNEEEIICENEDSKNILRDCFKSMVDTLSKIIPETINQVQLLVKELRRIIILWDELWLGTLMQHQNDIVRRQQQIELEIEKVTGNVNLNSNEKQNIIKEKYKIVVKPILFLLDQLYNITSVEPETPYEKFFQEKYLKVISEVIDKLKNPNSYHKPQESFHMLKILQNKFYQKSHRKSNTLKMQEISPLLANLRDTVICMPGLESFNKKNVTISSLCNQVTILPTKTKPKKLMFHGSDGKKYTYLFKGLEDLHLDERIMQFLNIANTMMAQIPDSSDCNLYCARHYSVIPLGPRSGLISWVDGTTPVFTLYKRWQQREAAKSNANNVLRPSELFFNKLNPKLQELGVKNSDSRKEWPLSVLKQVLNELMTETPSDLLARELWCHSINAGNWWQIIKKYSYSVAVMSIIGYIIGLGDRHLDNMLIDLTSGEVVHIDYNVCFEKGKTLRVPEKVPYRLTPNVRDALGVTGVEVSISLNIFKSYQL